MKNFNWNVVIRLELDESTANTNEEYLIKNEILLLLEMKKKNFNITGTRELDFFVNIIHIEG
jgi:hypothetical protein